MVANAASLSKRISRRLEFPVATLEDALAQLGTSHSGVGVVSGSAQIASLSKPTLDNSPALLSKLQGSYFPLQSEADVARAIDAEMPNLRPVGGWLRANPSSDPSA